MQSSLNSESSAVLRIELLTATTCSRCHAARAAIISVIENIGRPQLQFREIDVLDELDYAVGLGVLSTPAVAIDGELVFRSAPSAAAFRQALLKRMADRGLV